MNHKGPRPADLARFVVRSLMQKRIPRSAMLRTARSLAASASKGTAPVKLSLFKRDFWAWDATELFDLAQHNYLGLTCYQDLSEVRTIVDAGAHVGAMTAYFRFMYPHATIHAFEPNAANFALLTRNVGDLPGVHLHHAALAAPGLREVILYEQASQTSTIEQDFESSSTSRTTVRAVDSDGLVALVGSPIDFLKLDIEGGEYGFLEGMPPESSGVRYLYAEFHSQGFRDFPQISGLRDRFEPRYSRDFEHVTVYSSMNLFVYEVLWSLRQSAIVNHR